MTDHEERLERALISLEGMSYGDSLGARLEIRSVRPLTDDAHFRHLPPPPWRFTDDTNQAMSMVSVLRQYHQIDHDKLAQSLVKHFQSSRNYGMGTRELFMRFQDGGDWRKLAPAMFGGSGSFGSGAAMRSAPLGAYFADDLKKAREQAQLAAEVTHAHPEGIAGAVAIALGTAVAWQMRSYREIEIDEYLKRILRYMPPGEVQQGIERAVALVDAMGPDAAVADAVQVLGNGSRIAAVDTVPFVLWNAGRNLHHYEAAIWTTLSAGGDADTMCAMVGGIVAVVTGCEAIPAAWLPYREPLPNWLHSEVI